MKKINKEEKPKKEKKKGKANNKEKLNTIDYSCLSADGTNYYFYKRKNNK